LDKDFGPQRPSDLDRCKYTLYKNGEPPKKGYADPRNVEFAWTDELCESKGSEHRPMFVDDGASSNDCKQGNLGDCWLISAMSVLAERDELLVGGRRGMEYEKDMIIDKIIADLLSKGVYPPIFHRFRAIGLFVIRLFVEFQWVYVIVDERLPVDSKTRKPIFGRCRNVHEMWVSLIEKAFAKVYGCYENLISGYVDEGINHLTAFPSEKILIKNETTGVFPHKTIEQHYGGSEGLWKLLMERDNEGCLMGCSIKGQQGGPLILEGKDSGLIKNHAYSLNDIIELDDPTSKGAKLRLLRLRNPWGKSEWKGAWSSNSEEMTTHKAHIQAYINTLPPDEQFDMEADDGIFFIHYDDWKDNFTALFVNIDFPENWTGLRFHSKWTKSNAGGLPKRYENDHLERFAKNPQFMISPEQDMEVFFSMAQIGGRLQSDSQYFTYPFSETIKYGAVSVFKLPKEEKYLSKFSKEDLVFMSPIKLEKENAGRCLLKADSNYVIVCSLEKAGSKNEFYLSVYFDQPLRNVNCKRVFHPLDKNKGKEEVLPILIPEEAEKLVNRTPLWKIQLVKESLAFMITDEDEGVQM